MTNYIPCDKQVQSMAARAAYRHLLRTVDSHVTSVNNNQQWKDHIRTLFRAGAFEGDAADAAKKVELAEDYAFLVESVRLQKVSRLLRSWWYARRKGLVVCKSLGSPLVSAALELMWLFVAKEQVSSFDINSGQALLTPLSIG